MAWITEEDCERLIQEERRKQLPEPEPKLTVTTCTEAERAYLDAILGDGTPSKELQAMRGRIASERLNPGKRAALVRAWADATLARWRWEALMQDTDLGGYGAPLYEALSKEADELAESERPK